MTTSNCPGDWDSVIENKNPSRQKNDWRGFGGAVWTSQEQSWTKAQKTKLAAGLRILEYALDYGAREPEHAQGQWWKTNTDFG